MTRRCIRSLSVCVVLILSSPALAKSLTPPPPPSVPPAISEFYPSDLNGDKIDDELQVKLKQATLMGKQAATEEQTLKALAAFEEMVDVELIFKEPILQSQIDDFLRMGGEIDHIYHEVSYGWSGRVPLVLVESLPALMGPSLVQVDEPEMIRLYLDSATQTGRVRPVWRAGFAGNDLGFDGDRNITIGIIDSGVDANHPDLAGRCIDWNDLSGQSIMPRDHDGHGSHVAAIAVGTGDAGGADGDPLRYTYTSNGGSWEHWGGNVHLPSASCHFRSEARWAGSFWGILGILEFPGGDSRDSSSEVVAMNIIDLSSPVQVECDLAPLAGHLYAPVLLNPNDSLSKVVITSSVTNYPGVGDGFNRFRGVAPGCNWAGVRFEYDSGSDVSDGIGKGVDHLADVRKSANVKVMNISSGVGNSYGPTTSTSLRNKVRSAVRKGIVVVAAAGNGAAGLKERTRLMGDPARADLAVTVGAANELNALTDYSTYGVDNPSLSGGEGYKPDLIAPGGSRDRYRGIIAADSGSSDCYGTADVEPNDYSVKNGTSMSAPFVAGCAALVIDALQQRRFNEGAEPNALWDFESDNDPRLVKMVLCATATETARDRDNGLFSPHLQRAEPGPGGFPPGKDPYEGYGLINPDAAVEAVYLDYQWGTEETDFLGSEVNARRAWARGVTLAEGQLYNLDLTNPSGGDFDWYLYSAEPSSTGTPQLLASSTTAGLGRNDSIWYSSGENGKAIVVIKRVDGEGQFTLRSHQADGAVTVSGRVLGPDGTAIGDVQVAAQGVVGSDVLTDSSGAYSVVVPYAWTGEIGPVSSLYVFTPMSYSYATVLTDRKDQDFNADYTRLVTDVSTAFPVIPKRFTFDVLGDGWCAVGIVPSTGGHLRVYDNWQCSGSYVSSTLSSTSSGTIRNFVVLNGHRLGDTVRYVEVYNGSGACTIEAECGSSVDLLGSRASGAFTATEVLDVHQVSVTSGKRYFLTLDITEGDADLSVFLYSPSRSTGSRISEDDTVNSGKAGEDEFLIFTAGTSGVYGIVVVNENAESCSYTLEVKQLD